MLESLFSSQSLTAVVASGTSTFSRPIQVGEHNYANLTLNIRDIELLAGTPTIALVISPEGSNDGQGWTAVGGLGDTGTAVGVTSAEGYVLFAWLRVHVAFTVSGGAGDQAAVVFCLQANLKAR